MIIAGSRAIHCQVEYSTDGSRQSNETELLIDIYQAMRRAQEEMLVTCSNNDKEMSKNSETEYSYMSCYRTGKMDISVDGNIVLTCNYGDSQEDTFHEFIRVFEMGVSYKENREK